MTWWTVFDLDAKEKELKELELKTQCPDFWSDQKNAAAISQKISEIKEELAKAESLKKELADLQELHNLSDDAKDLEGLYQTLKEKIEKEELRAFLTGEYDSNNALLEIFSGAGGQDAQDWVTMLLRMYERYCAKKGFKAELLHQSFGEPGGPDGRIGTKHVTLEIKGNHAFGFLKKEAGGHRLLGGFSFKA